jgi:hypothetical protein
MNPSIVAVLLAEARNSITAAGRRLFEVPGSWPLCSSARNLPTTWIRALSSLALLSIPALATPADAPTPPQPGYARWTHGPPATPDFFPIAVWLQPPARAETYRRAGFNTYVGLWRGPTEDQIRTLRGAGMKLICEQNEVARRHLDDPTLIGWMHGDEPDNAQSLGEGKGYGPPISPARIHSDYAQLRAADPSRPILLNLGQGVAWDDWHGRGVRTRHPEDYPEYIRGGDIVSFDIYPVVHDRPAVSSNLWFVAQGVERLVRWAGSDRIVWNCIECTRISHPTAKPTPHQVRAEVWMSLIHGSRGLIYFVHEWTPRFNESALLDDAPMLEAVTQINTQIRELAPVLNEPGPAALVRVLTDPPNIPVASLARRHGPDLYVFTVGMRAASVAATFRLELGPAAGNVEVLGEARTLPLADRTFIDRFSPWDAHLYRIRGAFTNPGSQVPASAR